MTHLNSLKLPALQSQSKAPPAGRVVQVLQDNVVRYAYQPIGLVIADTIENASEGARLVKVEYRAERPVVDLESRLHEAYSPEEGGRRRRARLEQPRRYAGRHGGSRGAHRASLLDTLSKCITRWSRTPPLRYGMHRITSRSTMRRKECFSDRKRVADLFQLKPENVRVISPYLGGGFGSKGPVWSHVILAAMAARQVNRPVKLAVARPQMFGMLGCRSQTRQALKAGAKQDGTLTALQHDTYCHTSTFDDFVETASLAARMLYQSPNNSTTHKLVRSDIGQPSFMRAPGEASGTYGLEAAMDEMAYALPHGSR